MNTHNIHVQFSIKKNKITLGCVQLNPVYVCNNFLEAILMNTHNIHVQFLIKKIKITLNYPKSAVMGFFPWESRTSST